MNRSSLVLLAKSQARRVRRALGLSPIQKVMERLSDEKNVMLGELNALEAFAGNGDMHTVDYSKRVKSIDLWGFNEEHTTSLRKRYGSSTIKQVDSYVQVKVEDKHFSLIVLDTPPVGGGHYECFDMFPDVFRLVDRECIFILTVMPEINKALMQAYPNVACPRYVERRTVFYSTASNADRLDEKSIMQGIELQCQSAGFSLDWGFSQSRNGFAHYEVFKAVRTDSQVRRN